MIFISIPSVFQPNQCSGLAAFVSVEPNSETEVAEIDGFRPLFQYEPAYQGSQSLDTIMGAWVIDFDIEILCTQDANCRVILYQVNTHVPIAENQQCF